MLDFNILNEISISDSLFIDNDLEYVIQQIDLLFNTNVNDVLGDPSFGSNYDRYLYNLNISNYALEQKIYNDLIRLDLRGFTPQVSVHLVEGTVRDIAFIDIILSGKCGEFARSYIIN